MSGVQGWRKDLKLAIVIYVFTMVLVHLALWVLFPITPPGWMTREIDDLISKPRIELHHTYYTEDLGTRTLISRAEYERISTDSNQSSRVLGIFEIGYLRSGSVFAMLSPIFPSSEVLGVVSITTREGANGFFDPVPPSTSRSIRWRSAIRSYDPRTALVAEGMYVPTISVLGTLYVVVCQFFIIRSAFRTVPDLRAMFDRRKPGHCRCG